jgi:hypothetical protein
MRNQNMPPSTVNQPSQSHPSLKRPLTHLLPGLLGILLYLANNLDVIHGIIAPPPGYAPFGVQRSSDIAQYLTWLRGLGKGWLLPNYHAPWSTPVGFTVPGLVPVSILQRALSLNPVVALQLFSLAGYIFTAYALAFAYHTFCKTRRQALWSLLFAFGCVPMASLPGLSGLLHGHGMLSDSAGAVEFINSGDGFLHGLGAWAFSTYGTGTQVLAMALLARCCASNERRWLIWLAVVCLFSALIHPFEIFVTIPVAGVVLLRRPGSVIYNLASLLLVVIAAIGGLAPYLIQSYFVPWVHEIEILNRHLVSIMPFTLFWMVGPPAILVVVLLLFGLPKSNEPSAIILKTWFVATVLVFYVPGIPFAVHMLDGFFFVVGLLLTLQLIELLRRHFKLTGSPLRFLIVPIMVWMLYPHVAFRIRAWRKGNDIKGNDFPFASAIAPVDEFATLDWFRKNATPNDLVLAAEDAAPWLATAPMHVFASHYVFSLEALRPYDNALRNSFFDGTLTPLQALDLLDTLGIAFVVIPDGSPARKYLGNAELRVQFQSCSIFELPGARMKPFHDPRILALGT